MSRLTKEQTNALFDILSHYETYTEIESFKTSDAITYYGYPFTSHNPPASSSSSASLSSSLGIEGLSLNGYSSENVSSSKSNGAAKQGNSNRNSSTGDGDAVVFQEPELSSSPALQQIFSTYILPLPSVRDLTREFWAIRIQGLMVRFADVNLSESYDKGAMGARKTLATGASSVIEMLSRGALGGVPRREKEESEETELAKRTYKRNSANGLNRAWEDLLEEMVYGNLVNELFDHMAKTPDVEAHSPAAQAGIDYIVMHLAGFLHHIFIRSPDGQYLVKLIKNIHNLIPYQLVKQTLRVGNAATMINGMMRIFLAKLSVTGITNWVGLTKNEDDGMNLLQNIISMVLSWDANEFRKIVTNIEKADDGPTDEMLNVLRKHALAADRKEQQRLRKKSVAKERSIVQVILKEASTELSDSLTKEQHRMCLEYYSAQLSVRDRDMISNVLCRQPPDLLTRAVKEAVAAYDPMIRTVHNGVSLSDHLSDLQNFISEFIETSTSTEEREVAVEDYVALLYKNRHKLHKFIHAVASKAPTVWESLREWSNESIVRFRKEMVPGENISTMDQQLNTFITSLDQQTQDSILAAVDSHAAYLASLRSLSDSRLNKLAKRANDAETFGESPAGPGMYLARWQAILDETLITPAKRGGKKNSAPARHGSDVRHLSTMGKVGVGGNLEAAAARAGESGEPPAPDVGDVVRQLLPQFHGFLQNKCAAMERTG